MLMRDERANKDQESRAIRAIRARPGLAARGAQLPAKYHNGAVVLQGASWKNLFDPSDVVVGGVTKMVKAPLDTIPVFERV